MIEVVILLVESQLSPCPFSTEPFVILVSPRVTLVIVVQELDCLLANMAEVDVMVDVLEHVVDLMQRRSTADAASVSWVVRPALLSALHLLLALYLYVLTLTFADMARPDIPEVPATCTRQCFPD